ncbi:MAG: DUF411 domain-containing protein [Methyloceanibacter sp.]|uniref:DUF411 domain-containing protein n=1 Tax=Methyloceanibacter sp. TaxID=1965321 RepID=UPI003D9BD276
MIVRTLFSLLLGALLLPGTAVWAAPEIEVWKSPSCDCCTGWVEHLQDNGFEVTVKDTSPAMLDQIKRQAGISDKLASCHTGKIDGYVIEGHVPAADIQRLVSEKPDAAGLTVPGMPIGSPGMEVDDKRQPYDVLLLRKYGATEVFAKY